MDPEPATMPPSSTNIKGPMFRVFPPTPSPDRYMPALSTVLSGVPTRWEVLPSVARKLKFALIVRDNDIRGGMTNISSKKTITVIDADPFIVTYPSSNLDWIARTIKKVTWEKGNTDITPISCSKVNIKLSTDGGQTFTLIKGNTPNNGEQKIIVPNIPITTNAIIMVEAADNIFYNVSPEFAILPSHPLKINISNKTGNASICNKAANEQVFKIDLKNLFNMGFDVDFSLKGAPKGSTYEFSTSSINKSWIVRLTLRNLKNIAIVNYPLEITATSEFETKKLDILLNVNDNICKSSKNASTDSTLFNDLNIYPVPNNGKFTVEFTAKDKNLTVIRVFNSTGKLIENENFSPSFNYSSEEFTFTKARSGVYFIQVENAGKIETRKIIIK